MLRSLHIENIAVIRSADITFGDGFCVLTGETGAGKSVLIDGIGFLLGGKLGKDLIRSGETKALVSAVFENAKDASLAIAEANGIPSENGEFLLTRTVTSDGKTSARINGTPVTQAILREFGSSLVAVSGQNDSLRLLREAEQRSALDAYADNAAVREAYRVVYQSLTEVKRDRKKLETDAAERERLMDILQFQIKDIDAKKLRVGEEQTLEAERARLRSMESIVKQSRFCCRALTDHEQGNASLLIEKSAGAIATLASVIPEADEIARKLNDIKYEIDDLSERIRDFAPDTDGNPEERLDKIEGRLDALSKLKKKYGGSIEEVLAFRDEAAKRLAGLTNAEETGADLERREKVLTASAGEAAKRLTETRRAAAGEISRRVVETLKYLDMPKVRFEISVTPTECSESGADKIEFLLSANAGEGLSPMSAIASGGELSRIMLALSDVLSDAGGVGTVIYDEIDTGISGSTSRKIGLKLRASAENVQTLCVTHSAQIASLADTHFFISKHEVGGKTETSVEELADGERIDEIARILGGITVTQAQHDAAVDMIEEGKRIRQ